MNLSAGNTGPAGKFPSCTIFTDDGGTRYNLTVEHFHTSNSLLIGDIFREGGGIIKFASHKTGSWDNMWVDSVSTWHGVGKFVFEVKGSGTIQFGGGAKSYMIVSGDIEFISPVTSITVTLDATFEFSGAHGHFSTPGAGKQLMIKSGSCNWVQEAPRLANGATFRYNKDKDYYLSATPGVHSVITRERGDARYALKTSSERYKDNINPATPVNAGFWNLERKKFVWGGELLDDDPRRGELSSGLIAEEVATFFPDAVLKIDDRVEGLEPLPLIGALFDEINSLRKRIEELKNDN